MRMERMRMTLTSCRGRLVRIRWRDIVEDSNATANVNAIRESNRTWSLSDTYGVLLEADDEDVFVATTLGVDKTDASEKGNSVIQIPRALVVKAYLLKHDREVSAK